MARKGIGHQQPQPWSGDWAEGQHTSNPNAGRPNLAGFRDWPRGLEDFGARSRVDYQDVTMWRAKGPLIAHPTCPPEEGLSAGE